MLIASPTMRDSNNSTGQVTTRLLKDALKAQYAGLGAQLPAKNGIG